MKSHEIKKFFKQLKIEVKARNSKHFMNVWIAPSPNDDIRAPLHYPHEFPVNLREKMLKIIYGGKWVSLPGRLGNAGNINNHSMAASQKEWEILVNQ